MNQVFNLSETFNVGDWQFQPAYDPGNDAMGIRIINTKNGGFYETMSLGKAISFVRSFASMYGYNDYEIVSKIIKK